MVFTSRGFAPGSVGYLLLTIVAASIIVVSTTVFGFLLCFEVYRSIKVRAARSSWVPLIRNISNLKACVQVYYYCDMLSCAVCGHP